MSDRIAVTVEAGRRLPGVLPRAALVVLSTAAFLVAPPFPATIAVALAVAAAIVPAFPSAWGAILVVALAQLGAPQEAGEARLYLALALAHLLHVVASLATVADPRGTMQARVLIRPLRRFLLIQVPAQLLLAGVLLLHGSLTSSAGVLAPLIAAVGAAVVVGVVVLLARRR